MRASIERRYGIKFGHAEQAMKEADRRKDEFLAILAHELRNPLAPIANYAQMLKQYYGDGDAVRKASVAIQRQVEQMARLIDDPLDVSRISSGKIELHRATIDMAQVIRQAVDAIQPFFDRRGIVKPLDQAELHGLLTSMGLPISTSRRGR